MYLSEKTTTMHSWTTASTASVEFYELRTEHREALIFRRRGDRRGYTACVVGRGITLTAETTFATLEAAKTWVAEHIPAADTTNGPYP